MPTQIGVNQIGQKDFRFIIAGDYPRVKFSVVLPANTKYQLGTVLMSTGPMTAAGVPCAPWDGEEDSEVFGILAETVDGTDANVTGTINAIAFVSGEFIGPRLIFPDPATDPVTGGDSNWVNYVSTLRPLNIYLHGAQLNPYQ